METCWEPSTGTNLTRYGEGCSRMRGSHNPVAAASTPDKGSMGASLDFQIQSLQCWAVHQVGFGVPVAKFQGALP